MALNGIQIFKLTPKKNCKECGCPTCMAFSMKVAQGAMKIEQCPHCLLYTSRKTDRERNRTTCYRP